MMVATAAGAKPADVWSNLDEIGRRIAGMRRRFLFADFDGTLAPMAPVPALAAVPQDLKSVLRALAGAGTVTAVVSGRAVDDLKPRVGLPLIYAGDHGLDIRGAGLEFTHPAAQDLRYQLLAICNRLRAGIEPFAGAFVECKRLSASVHYRLVERGEVGSVAAVVYSTLELCRGFQVCEGNEVFDIRPKVSWNKGSAARWILERNGGEDCDCICVGDDASDEDMFTEMRAGLSVRVGADGFSSARYRLEQAEVSRFLTLVHEAAGGWRHRGEVTYGSSG